jgi:hypothetical protein
MNSNQPRWQPISMARTLLRLMEDELQTIEGLLNRLESVRSTPHVLDNDTVDRVIAMCTQTLELAPVYEAQLTWWRGSSPTEEQRRDVERFAELLAQNTPKAKKLLALGRELREGTIDNILNMSDEELGRAFIEGRIKPPRK